MIQSCRSVAAELRHLEGDDLRRGSGRPPPKSKVVLGSRVVDCVVHEALSPRDAQYYQLRGDDLQGVIAPSERNQEV